MPTHVIDIQTVTVTDGISRWVTSGQHTTLILVIHAVRIIEAYHCNAKQLLQVFFVFKQDSALALCELEEVNFLTHNFARCRPISKIILTWACQ